jgi:uroporphyrinogen III methyltransferase/synthase
MSSRFDSKDPPIDNQLVYLVGAGPGDPELLTLRAVECLGRADLVLYDRLVPLRLLEFARPGTELVCVTQLASRHSDRGTRVQEMMIRAARSGRCVVRLKGGDPFVFGRGGEEAEALRDAGVPYEIVPGITAGIGAAAYAGIPLTHRSLASTVAFVAGHEDSAKHESAVNWSRLAGLPGTLVIYMGMARLEHVAAQLISYGRRPDTPSAVVQLATTSSQRTVDGFLGEIAGRAEAAGLSAPAVLIVGEVVALRDRLSWFEKRPLFGKRVVVTRPRHQATGMVRRLEELGAIVFTLPLVEIRRLTDWSRVDDAIARLKDFDWLVFTSANGVDAFLGRVLELKADIRALGSIKLAAIGRATADALRSYHVQPDLVPARFRSEELSRALGERARGQRILVARADRGREVLREELAAVANVEEIAVYCQVDVKASDSEVLETIERAEVDYIALTSSNIARALDRAVASRQSVTSGRVKLVTISPVTSAAVHEMGLPVAAEATTYTTEGLIEALVKCVGREENALAQVSEGVPTQVGQQARTNNDQNVNGAVDTRAEGNLEGKVQTEQKQQQPRHAE